MHEGTTRSRLGSITEGRPVQTALLELDVISAQIGRSASDALAESAIDEDDSSDDEPPKSGSESEIASRTSAATSVSGGTITGNSVLTSPADEKKVPLPPVATTAQSAPLPSHRASLSVSSSFVHPTDLAAQLASHPKLAALRSPAGLAMTPMSAASGGPSPARSAPQTPGIAAAAKSSNYFTPNSPPILANPKCSGYFVEPVSGLMSGFDCCMLSRLISGRCDR